MALQDIVVPQMGEGLQEVSIVALHKQPGDFVGRDEPLYSMETDKAVVEVESPASGTLAEWLAGPGETLAIGTPIAKIETSSAAAETGSSFAGAAAEGSSAQIPPRTRAYCRERGISEEEMRRIPAPSGKLMPADVDSWLAAGGGRAAEAADSTIRPLSETQRALVRHMRRSQQTVIPATMKRAVQWGAIEALVQARRETGSKPTEFQTFAYCVARAAADFPKFRSTMAGDEAAHEYAHVNLGMAVAREGGDLVTAVVRDADAKGFDEYLSASRAAIDAARAGRDQADAATQIVLTYMGAFGVMDAVPVLVAPAIAVLFVGATFEQNGKRLVNLSLTFDHRLINGVEAAEFVGAIVERAEDVERTIG